MTTVLTLFPDTNVFVQCRSLEEIDWSQLGAFDRIDLLICRPVQVEIDRHKSKASGRLSKRARTASALFKRALDAPGKVLVLSSGKPELRLQVRIDLRPSKRLEEHLDYQERDDQLGVISFSVLNKSV